MRATAPEFQTLRPEVQELSLTDALQILVQRRRFIALFSLALAIFAAGIVLLMKNQFTASVIVLPPTQNSSSGSSLLAQLGQSSILGSSLGMKSQGDLMLSLMRTATVENEVIEKFGLQRRYNARKLSDAKRAFESHSKLSLGAKDGLVTVHVTDTDPKLAADIANAYVDAYQKLSANLAITEASQRRIFYEQQLLESKENLARADTALKNAEQATGVLQVEGQTRTLIESAAALRAQVVAKEVQLQSMRSYATDTNPEYLQAKEQLSALQGQLARMGASDQDPALLTPKGKVSEATLEYIGKLRDVKYYETISQLIARQYEIAKQDEARQGIGIQIVERATPPDVKSGPMRTFIVLLAFLMGVFIASGLSLVAARMPESFFRNFLSTAKR